MLVQIPAQSTEKDDKLRFEYGVRLDDHFLGLEWSKCFKLLEHNLTHNSLGRILLKH